jgi:biopolymer transport protein ExbD
MKLHRTVKYEPGLFNAVPLVNVLFLVLAFVTLTNTFVLQPGISISLPFSSFSLGPQRNPQVVSITAGAIPTVYFRDEKVTIQDLDQKLASSATKDRSLMIRADRAVPYELISQVMNLGVQHGYSVYLAASSQR